MYKECSADLIVLRSGSAPARLQIGLDGREGACGPGNGWSRRMVRSGTPRDAAVTRTCDLKVLAFCTSDFQKSRFLSSEWPRKLFWHLKIARVGLCVTAALEMLFLTHTRGKHVRALVHVDVRVHVRVHVHISCAVRVRELCSRSRERSMS